MWGGGNRLLPFEDDGFLEICLKHCDLAYSDET